jgi:hypothetical protein
MKKILLALVCAFTSLAIQAQQTPYQYSYWTEPYVSLSDAQEIDLGTANNELVPLPFGFTMLVDSAAYDFGLLDLSSSVIFLGDEIDEEIPFAIFAYGVADFPTGIPGVSKVRYKTEGTAPNRIFKFEAYRLGFGNAVDDRVSFQVWLYETRNIIQIRLADQIIENPSSMFYTGNGPLVGLLQELTFSETEEFYTIGYSHWIVGSGVEPVDTILYNYQGLDAPPFSCEELPENNSVFTFTPANVVSAPAISTNQMDFRIIPNPVHTTFRLDLPATAQNEPGLLNLFDARGALIWTQNLAVGAQNITLPGTLNSGIYQLQLVQNQQVASRKMIVTRN